MNPRYEDKVIVPDHVRLIEDREDFLLIDFDHRKPPKLGFLENFEDFFVIVGYTAWRSSGNNWHVALQLDTALPLEVRLVLQMAAGSDKLRSVLTALKHDGANVLFQPKGGTIYCGNSLPDWLR